MHYIIRATTVARRSKLRILIFVLLIGAVSLPALSWAGIKFGVRCQASYQSGWWPTWDNTDQCTYFSDGILAQGNTRRFNYPSGGMISVHSKFVDPNDGVSGGPDYVDLMLMSVHGTYDSTSFYYPFWNNGVYWISSEAKLGNNGQGARMFASYSCSTMNTDTFARLSHLFSGGLIVAMGSYDAMWNGCPWGDTVQWYMSMYNVDEAWLSGTWDSYNGNHPIVWATGYSVDECFARMDSTYSGVMNKAHEPSAGVNCWWAY